MLQIWKSSRDAKSLTSYSSAEVLVPSLISFDNTFHIFIKLVDRSESPVQSLDDFYQTWDECDDFLQHYPAIQNRTRRYGKTGPNRGVRYVYTHSDVKDFGKRVQLLLYIMQAKTDDILLNQLMRIHTATEANRRLFSQNLGLGLRLRNPLAQVLTAQPLGAIDEEEKMLHLYDFLDGIIYQLKRTATQAASAGDVNSVSWGLNRGEIELVWKQLRTRFREHHIQSRNESGGLQDIVSASFYDEQDEKGLQQFSARRLHGLQKEYRILRAQQSGLTTRKRVYGKRYSPVAEPPMSDLLLPGPALGGEEATLTIDGTTILIRSLDVVNCPAGRLIVSCLKTNDYLGTLHFLPPISKTYPYTFHKDAKPFRFESEVSFHESDHYTVYTISKQGLVEMRPSIPFYNFPARPSVSAPTYPDALTFQTTMKEKLSVYTFQMDKISSDRGGEALNQPLKLWMDLDGKKHSISFLQNQQVEPTCHLEFALADFAPGHLGTHYKDPRSIQLTFRRKPSPSKHHRSSLGSLSSLKRRVSSSVSLNSLGSFRNRRRSSASSVASDDVVDTGDPAPRETNPQSPTDGSNDPADSMAVTSVHPYAEALKFLNLTFSSDRDLSTFKLVYNQIKSGRITPSTSLNSTPRSMGGTESTFQTGRTSPLIEDEEALSSSFHEYKISPNPVRSPQHSTGPRPESPKAHGGVERKLHLQRPEPENTSVGEKCAADIGQNEISMLGFGRTLYWRFRCQFRPSITAKNSRLEWNCDCGVPLYGDFTANDPDEIEKFAIELGATISNLSGVRTVPTAQGQTPTAQPQSTGITLASRAAQQGSASTANPIAPPPAAHPSAPGPTFANGVAPPAPPTQLVRKFAALCVNTGEYNKTLAETDLTSVTSDREMFHKLRESYQSVRGFRAKAVRWFLIKPVQIQFVQFAVEDYHRVDIIPEPPDCTLCAPDAEVLSRQYKIHQHVARKVHPPITSDAFLHYWKCCSTERSLQGSKWLSRFPTKLNTKLEDMRRTSLPDSDVLGWGIHIVEGLNKAFVTFLTFLVLVFSGATAGWYTIWKTDVSGGFAVGSYIVAFWVAFITALYFQWIQE